MATSKAKPSTTVAKTGAAAAETKNELAVRESHAVATTEMAAAFDEDSGQGMEGVDADSVAIPFLTILQKTSPQVDPEEGAYLPDAKPGMFFNTVTKELFDGKEGVKFVPCYFSRKFLQWGAREAGGGFKGEVDPAKVADMKMRGQLVEMENRLYVPDENGTVNPKKSDRIADTRTHYILFLNPKTGACQQAVLALTSTQIKKSKQLMANLGGVTIESGGLRKTPPTFANIVHATTIGESNEKGSWSGLATSLDGFVKDSNTYQMAKQFYKLICDGKATVNYEGAGLGDAAEGGGERPGSQSPDGRF